MSGYSGFSKSNNAAWAENDGLFSASILAKKLGVKAGAIKALLAPSEWHHTSKFFNKTDCYSYDVALEIIDRLRAWNEPEKEFIVFEGCSGRFLQWSGTRNYPRAAEIAFTGIRATKKGRWFTLELNSGLVRRSADTRGFQLFDADGRMLVFN